MSPSDKVGSIGLLWNMNPWLVALFVFVFDFVAVSAVASANFERWRDLWRNKSFAIGDFILLPTYAGLADYVFHHQSADHRWWQHPWLQLLILLVSVVYTYEMEGPVVEREHSKSDVYHFALTAIMFYIMVSAALPLLFGDHRPLWACLLAVACGLSHSFLGLATDRMIDRIRPSRFG